MHDALRVRVCQGVTDLRDQIEFGFEREQGLFLDVAAQVIAHQQFHGDIGQAFGLPQVVNHDDAGMAQARTGACLTVEALPDFLGDGRSGADDFQSYVAIEHGVAGAVYASHRTGAQLLENLVPAQ